MKNITKTIGIALFLAALMFIVGSLIRELTYTPPDLDLSKFGSESVRVILHDAGRTSSFEATTSSVRLVYGGFIEFRTVSGVLIWWPQEDVGLSSAPLNHYQAPIINEFDDAPDPDGNVYPRQEPTPERRTYF